MPLNLDNESVYVRRGTVGPLPITTIRHIEHIKAPVFPEGSTPPNDARKLAQQYIEDLTTPPSAVSGPILDLHDVQRDLQTDIESLPTPPPFEPKSHLRFASLNSYDGSTIVNFQQTLHGIRVWQSGVSVSIHEASSGGPLMVTSMQSTLHLDLDDENTFQPPNLLMDEYLPEKITPSVVAERLGFSDANRIKDIHVTRLLIYRYDERKRLYIEPEVSQTWLDGRDPVLPDLQKRVDDEVMDLRHRAITEVRFSMQPFSSTGSGLPEHWRVFIDTKLGDVLYLRRAAASCFGRLFPNSSGATTPPVAKGSVLCVDPVTKNGGASLSDFNRYDAAKLNAFLKNEQQCVNLENLERTDPQRLVTTNKKGFVSIYGGIYDPTDAEYEPEEPRTSSAVPDFTYARPYSYGRRFAAVNAYYHCDAMFRMMESLGIKVKGRSGYFRGITDFPIKVDPHGTDYEVNALVKIGDPGTTQYRIEGIVFGSIWRGDDLLANASDIRVALHELSHVLLTARTEWYSFDFAHSAGDSLAAILCDPGSMNTQGNERYNTFPWLLLANPNVAKNQWRYHGGSVDNRNDMLKWGWWGEKDLQDEPDDPQFMGGYYREQILAMTLFRIYQALGGDSPLPERKRLAARYMAYLIIKAFTLMPMYDQIETDKADKFDSALQEVDQRILPFDDNEFGIISLGVARKVIRWSFMEQSMYGTQPATCDVNSPFAVDVYIDDGRDGDYKYQSSFPPEKVDIWNRHSGNAGTGREDHQDPKPNQTNYLFVKVRNGGVCQAKNVNVTGYFRTTAGWETEKWYSNGWKPLASISAQTLGSRGQPNSSKILGPFQWDPGNANTKACVLMSVSANGDPSGLDSETVSSQAGAPKYERYKTHPVPLWWLVPADNNIAARDMDVGS